MPKNRIKKTAAKPSALKIALLLIQFSLVKLGSLPILIVKSSLFVVRRLLTINYQLFHLPRSRGRPRKSWVLPYYSNKFKLFFKKRISRKTKISLSIVAIILSLYSYTSFIFTAAYQLPSPTKLISTDKALTTEFLDRNGKLLYRMYEGKNRSLVTLDQLPKYVISATIATEDKNFYKHPGIDTIAIIRALIANIRNHADNQGLEGASTITQQLIKNSLLTPEKTYSRKLKEIILALWTERIYSKNQILQMYLNEAPYGGPAWGIEAASQTYFDKSSKDLTLAQAAYLAGLPASPTQFSPYGTNPELAKNRQKEVLRRMVENKYITQSDSESAYLEDIQLKPQINNILAPHFVMYVRDLLAQRYGQRVVSQGGLKITTTLDSDIQKKTEQIVSEEAENLTNLNVKNAASMITDPKTGQILAMVGSKDYHQPDFGSYNVTLSLRQPGSSIKVITYATAFKQGYGPGNTILDVPVSFRDNWGNSYSPVNYDGKYHGPVSIRTALGSSYNIPAVKMLAAVGVDEMIKTATDMGITTFTDPKRYGLSLTLGGGEVKMIDMMSVYGTLSQLGQTRNITPVLKVTNSDGQVLEEFNDQPKQTLSPQVSYLVTDILSDNNARTPAFGSDSLLKIGDQKVAVKTGTTDNKRDNWTFGYTQDFVIGVWVGNNDNTPMNPSLTSGITGAAPIWNRIAKSLLELKPSLSFNKPNGIIATTIDGRRDIAISNNITKSLVRIVKQDDKLVFSDSQSSFTATPSATVVSSDTSTNN